MRIILRPSGEAAAEQRFAGRRSGMNKSKLQSVILRTLVYNIRRSYLSYCLYIDKGNSKLVARPFQF